MDVENLKKIINVCENSQLDYFKYECSNEGVLFQKRAIQTIIEPSKDNIEDEKKYIKSMDTGIIIKASYVGIIHLEQCLQKLENPTWVEKDEILCTIEAMKLYNSITSPMKGIIGEIFIKDGDMVEYGQPLFSLEERE